MKKILFTVLIILLIVLAYFAMFNGLSIANMKVLSVQQIMMANDKLTNDIEQVKALLQKDYPVKKEELSASVTTLLEEKEKYFKLAKVSTDQEITKANTEETYLIEYLWARIGGHATKRGILLKFDVNSSDSGEKGLYSLSFTAKGEYTKLIQFISELEDDDKLSFTIENFKMTKSDTLTATFNVRNVRIKSESITNAQASTIEQQNNQNPVQPTDGNTTTQPNNQNQTSTGNEQL